MPGRKPDYFDVKRLNARRFPAKVRREWEKRVEDLESIIDPVRYGGLITMIAFYECQCNQLRQELMQTGPLTKEKAVKSLLQECRTLDSTLIALYKGTGLVTAPNVRRQDASGTSGDLTEIFKGVGRAKTKGKESVPADNGDASTGDTGALPDDSDAIPDTKQTEGGDSDAA